MLRPRNLFRADRGRSILWPETRFRSLGRYHTAYGERGYRNLRLCWEHVTYEIWPPRFGKEDLSCDCSCVMVWWCRWQRTTSRLLPTSGRGYGLLSKCFAIKLKHQGHDVWKFRFYFFILFTTCSCRRDCDQQYHFINCHFTSLTSLCKYRNLSGRKLVSVASNARSYRPTVMQLNS